jgi:putative hemolysin
MFEGATLATLLLLAFCILASAFFSSAEAAFLSLQRVRLHHIAETRGPNGKRVARMAEHPERLLPTILLGNNLVNTGAAALATLIALAYLNDGQAALVATLGVTLLLLVFGETVPKVLAARNAESFALAYARPLIVMERIFLPIASGLQFVSRAAVKAVGGDWNQRILITEEEIRTAISVGREAGAVETQEADMLTRVFRFGDRQVREILTPRTELITIEQGTTLREFLAMYATHSHTRFPVIEKQLDDIMGVLRVKDVVVAMAELNLDPEGSITHLARPAYFAPETKLAGDLFAELQQTGNGMAIVVDEFGGTAGLVTLKQLVEEVVGFVGGEEEQPELDFRALDEDTYEVDAGIQVDEANEKLALNLPEGEYETVAGFILEELGRIPDEGNTLTYADLSFTVSEMKGVKIEKVIVRRIPAVSEDEEHQE